MKITEDFNIYFYRVEKVALITIERYGTCWLCQSMDIVGFDMSQKAEPWGGFRNICRRCIPVAKVLAGLRGWTQ